MLKYVRTHELDFDELMVKLTNETHSEETEKYIEALRFISTLGFDESLDGATILDMEEDVISRVSRFIGESSEQLSFGSRQSEGKITLSDLNHSMNFKRNIENIRHIKRVRSRDLF